MHAQGHIEERLYSITERLSALFPKKIDLSLGRIERFLGQLGNPHLDIPPAIHVAGTNGKGSSIAFLRSCLEHLGHTCHAMTSPHLVRFNERIILAGEEISTDHYMKLLDECERVNAGEQISYFEMVIATTFLAFSRTEADYSLVETGLGGRLDATNVVPDPRATLITTISFDHMDYLGDSLTKIASEKAGIMKMGTPCVIGAQTDEALDAGVMAVFEEQAEVIGCPLLRYGHEWTVEKTANGFALFLKNVRYDFPMPSLLGEHQLYNVAAVLVVMLTLFPDAGVKQLGQLEKLGEAISHTTWRARLQKLDQVEGDVWLDGGHNDSAGQALGVQAKAWAQVDHRPLHLILGMVDRKDPQAFLTPLLPYLESITVVDIPHAQASFPKEALQNKVQSFASCDVGTAQSWREGLMKVPEGGRVLIAGSLYLAGAVLADIENTLPQQNEW